MQGFFSATDVLARLFMIKIARFKSTVHHSLRVKLFVSICLDHITGLKVFDK